MYKTITLRRGLDLHLAGAVEENAPAGNVRPDRIALVPDDFPGFTPKVVVKPGDEIAAGEPVMIDKTNMLTAIVSPVDGVVDEVVRGDRRKVLRIVISCKPEQAQAVAGHQAAATDADEIRRRMLEAGVWAMMRQLPYDIVPDPAASPRDIFITTFDTAPLATPLMPRVEGKQAAIAAGIEALLTLTAGKIYISVGSDEDAKFEAWKQYAESNGRVEIVCVHGSHPASLPSIQASNLNPVNKGETVWLLDVETLARIGGVATTGCCSWTTTVALTGSEVERPHLVKTIIGAELSALLKGELKKSDHHQRIISGNVLTGWKESTDGFLRYPYRQVTVIPEGDDVDEFMGWASLSPRKMSQSRSFPSRLLNIFGARSFSPDARLNGGRRAMIMSEQYENVLPMNIMAEHLIKAIMAHDIDKMEALGIYEVTPEDFALCEYVDPSKLELQKIVREGLDYLRKELS